MSRMQERGMTVLLQDLREVRCNNLVELERMGNIVMLRIFQGIRMQFFIMQQRRILFRKMWA